MQNENAQQANNTNNSNNTALDAMLQSPMFAHFSAALAKNNQQQPNFKKRKPNEPFDEVVKLTNYNELIAKFPLEKSLQKCNCLQFAAQNFLLTPQVLIPLSGWSFLENYTPVQGIKIS